MNTFVLDATTKSITAVMAGAPATTNPDFTTAYADATATAFIEGSNDGVMNGTTPVTIVAAPAASTRRVIKSITIMNRDTVAVVITLNLVSAGGTRQIVKVTLAVGETFTTDGIYTSSGALKMSVGTFADAIHATTNKTTPVDADELGIWDSVAGLLNKLTWANLKATLINTALTWTTTISQAVTSSGAGSTFNQSGTGDIAAFQDAGVATMRVPDQGGVVLVPQAGGFQNIVGLVAYDSVKKRLVLYHESHNYPVPIDLRNGFRNEQFRITY